MDRMEAQVTESRRVGSLEAEMMSLAKHLKKRTQTIHHALSICLTPWGKVQYRIQCQVDRGNAKLIEQLGSFIFLPAFVMNGRGGDCMIPISVVWNPRQPQRSPACVLRDAPCHEKNGVVNRREETRAQVQATSLFTVELAFHKANMPQRLFLITKSSPRRGLATTPPHL
ncbi:hypothetical protein PsorP6_016914 [Peronosclerospora sorghi]|uniref:Uncharacterized protein n=1 Tax=Peronosclerospora sorghi TaxID=230839 RepID=A0ACC0WBW6_9STRA|nr:hypothetical protein PsorP6_016914 [Peronosclerospora sorghi]